MAPRRSKSSHCSFGMPINTSYREGETHLCYFSHRLPFPRHVCPWQLPQDPLMRLPRQIAKQSFPTSQRQEWPKPCPQRCVKRCGCISRSGVCVIQNLLCCPCLVQIPVVSSLVGSCSPDSESGLDLKHVTEGLLGFVQSGQSLHTFVTNITTGTRSLQWVPNDLSL